MQIAKAQTVNWNARLVTIVDRTNWLGAQQIPKGMRKLLCVNVEQTMTVNSVLFYVSARMFLLVSCSIAFQYLLCFVHSQGQRTKEIENKNIQQRVSQPNLALSAMR